MGWKGCVCIKKRIVTHNFLIDEMHVTVYVTEKAYNNCNYSEKSVCYTDIFHETLIKYCKMEKKIIHKIQKTVDIT